LEAALLAGSSGRCGRHLQLGRPPDVRSRGDDERPWSRSDVLSGPRLAKDAGAVTDREVAASVDGASARRSRSSACWVDHATGHRPRGSEDTRPV